MRVLLHAIVPDLGTLRPTVTRNCLRPAVLPRRFFSVVPHVLGRVPTNFRHESERSPHRLNAALSLGGFQRCFEKFCVWVVDSQQIRCRLEARDSGLCFRYASVWALPWLRMQIRWRLGTLLRPLQCVSETGQDCRICIWPPGDPAWMEEIWLFGALGGLNLLRTRWRWWVGPSKVLRLMNCASPFCGQLSEGGRGPRKTFSLSLKSTLLNFTFLNVTFWTSLFWTALFLTSLFLTSRFLTSRFLFSRFITSLSSTSSLSTSLFLTSLFLTAFSWLHFFKLHFSQLFFWTSLFFLPSLFLLTSCFPLISLFLLTSFYFS